MMALDPELLRQKRLERKKQRQAAQKKFWLRLTLAILAIIGCTVAIVLMTRPAAPSLSAPQPSGETQMTQPARNEEITSITIAAVGDVNITEKVVASGTTVTIKNQELQYKGRF